MRASTASVTSTGETFFRRTSAASSSAGSQQRSWVAIRGRPSASGVGPGHGDVHLLHARALRDRNATVVLALGEVRPDARELLGVDETVARRLLPAGAAEERARLIQRGVHR